MFRFIKKFGLAFCDLTTMIENVNFFLRGVTITIDSQRVPFFFYISTFISGVCYFYAYVFSTVWMVFIHFPKTNDIIASAVAISLSTGSLTCITKLIFMKMYADDIKEIVTSFLQCDSQVVPGTRFALNIRKNLRLVKRRALVSWILLVTDATMYLIMPFMMPGRHLPEDLYVMYGLDPMTETPNYEISSLLTAISIFFAVYIMVNVAAFVTIIVGYIEAQMFALSEELAHLWDDSQNYYTAMKHNIHNKLHAVYVKNVVVNEFARIRLRDIIKFHILNINLLNKMDERFRNILAIEFGLMAFALIAELLGGLKNTYLELPFTLVQVFIECLIGQRLIDSSNAFEDALYCCQWENFNIDNRKIILLMLQNAQKTLVLSAGGVTKLSFVCLASIIRSTYSAYTTLQSVVNK